MKYVTSFRVQNMPRSKLAYWPNSAEKDHLCITRIPDRQTRMHLRPTTRTHAHNDKIVYIQVPLLLLLLKKFPGTNWQTVDARTVGST